MKAIFLDRDGVIIDNTAHYYIYKKEDVRFINGVFDNLLLLKQQGFVFFIVTNQGGISKKQYTAENVRKVHQHIRSEFEKRGISIREIYFCPHHESRENCLCRKPAPLMIEKLIARFQINPDESYFIGDSDSDIQAAESAGVKGIKITGNENMLPFLSKIIAE